jgi:hypothetical protein
MMRVLILALVLFHLPNLAACFEVSLKETGSLAWASRDTGISLWTMRLRLKISTDLLNVLDADVVNHNAHSIQLRMTELAAAQLRDSRPDLNVRLLY